MKILVVGNCQARPIADLLGIMSPSAELLETVVVQTSNAKSAADEVRRIESADVVLTQMIHPTFKAEHLRTPNVRALRSRGGLVTWPNLYFTGYNPELCYVRRPGRPTLTGPMGDYHIRTVIDAFLAGEPAAEAKRRCADRDYNATAFAGAAEKSLRTLEQRAQSLDIRMVPYIEERYREDHLFHTFNHPSLVLLVETARALLHHLGLSVEVEVSPRMLPEPLGLYMLPVNPAFEPRSHVEGPRSVRTSKHTYVDGTFKHVPGYRICSFDSLIDDFYRYYATQCVRGDFAAYEAA